MQGEVVFNDWVRDFIRGSISMDLRNISEGVYKRPAKFGRYELQFRKDSAHFSWKEWLFTL